MVKIIDIICGALLLTVIVGALLLIGVLTFVVVSLWILPLIAAWFWSLWWLLVEVPVIAFYYFMYRRVAVGKDIEELTIEDDGQDL